MGQQISQADKFNLRFLPLLLEVGLTGTISPETKLRLKQEIAEAQGPELDLIVKYSAGKDRWGLRTKGLKLVMNAHKLLSTAIYKSI